MPEIREQDLDRCDECGQLGAEWHETFRRNLHPACVGPWMAAEADYWAQIAERESA